MLQQNLEEDSDCIIQHQVKLNRLERYANQDFLLYTLWEKYISIGNYGYMLMGIQFQQIVQEEEHI
ncbi:unnamed protein product [Paramecium octaurelia]|uniref:Uncharacterized protein n=1 Tax=Paramecium octaurelia TaxID=43137 RepID=A0A8S1U5J8_PAROT|nr:unnamed protein product [Paramecium octaurelia]